MCADIILQEKDVKYLMEEVFQGCSALSQSSNNLTLTAFHPDKPFGPQNCICLTKKEAKIHKKQENIRDNYPIGFIQSIEAILSEVKLSHSYSLDDGGDDVKCDKVSDLSNKNQRITKVVKTFIDRYEELPSHWVNSLASLMEDEPTED